MSHIEDLAELLRESGVRMTFDFAKLDHAQLLEVVRQAGIRLRETGRQRDVALAQVVVAETYAEALRIDQQAHAIECAERDEALRTLDAAQRWKPIETAPMDGSLVLVWMAGWDGAVHSDYYRLRDLGADGWSHGWTHWLPYPAPPALEGEA